MAHNTPDAELIRFGDFVQKSLHMLEVTNYEEIHKVVDCVSTLVMDKFDHPILLAWAIYAEEASLMEDLRGMVIGLTSIMCMAHHPREMEADYALMYIQGIDTVDWTRMLAETLKEGEDNG